MKKVLLIFLGLVLSLTLFACQDRKIKYTGDECYVAFYVGKNEETPSAKKYKKGDKIEKPKIKTKAGAIVGWYTKISFDDHNNIIYNEDDKWNFNNIISESMTLYAKIAERTIMINYHLDSTMKFKLTNGTIQNELDEKFLKFDYNKGIDDLPEILKSGHLYKGFFYKPLHEMDPLKDFPFKTIKSLDDIVGEADVIDLYPIMEAREITISFVSESGNPSPTYITFGKPYKLSEMKPYNGKPFLGWYTKHKNKALRIKVENEGIWQGYPYYKDGVIGEILYNTDNSQFSLYAHFGE